jgi:hypothetical protein
VGKHQPNRNVAVRLGQREDIPAVQTFLAEEGELSPVAIGVLAHADLVFWIAVEAGRSWRPS